MIITHQTTHNGIITMCWRYLENPTVVDDDTDFQLVSPYWETVALQPVCEGDNCENIFFFDASPGETVFLTQGE